MQTYINKLEECTSLLADAGQPVTDEDQAWTMLAGLPSSKDTLVMGYTSSLGDAKLAKDKVKELLLFEDVRCQADNRNEEHDKNKFSTAMPTISSSREPTKPNKEGKLGLKCFECGGENHYSYECPSTERNARRGRGNDRGRRGRWNRRSRRGNQISSGSSACLQPLLCFQ